MFVAGAPGADQPHGVDFARRQRSGLSRGHLRRARGHLQRGHARLIDGGADAILIETIFDTLNAKAAIYAVRATLDAAGVDLPIIISGTITDASGRTLSGQTVEAFWASVRHARPITISLNCALGVKQLRPYVEELSRLADTNVGVYPNAGLPNAFGEYDEAPADTASVLGDLAHHGHLNLVGGCCGTTPAHIRAIADRVRCEPVRKKKEHVPRLELSGLEAFNLTQDIRFVNVGERTNVTGSAKFRKLIEANDYPAALSIARQQVQDGAQIIDVNMDEGMLDSEAAMVRFLNLIAAEPDIARVPVMIDSSKWTVIEAGLKCIQGKGVVNSISLKEGEEAFLAHARKVHELRRGRGGHGLRREGPGRYARAQGRRSASAATSCSRRSWASRPKTSSSIRTSSRSPPASRSTTATAWRSSKPRARSASAARTRTSPAA